MRPALATASVTTMNSTVPFSATFFLPCAAGGTGESVDMSGTFHLLRQTVINTTGGTTLRGTANPQDVTGVGETTGASYRYTGVEVSNNHGSVGGALTYILGFDIVGHGGATTFRVHMNTHVTIDANGTVTASVANVFSTCS